MPLPQALLARLAKRGIVESSLPPKTASKTEEVEEVFAEDYDDPSKPEIPEEKDPPAPVVVPQEPVVTPPVQEKEPIYRETTDCPSRSNPYHVCVPYCKKKYGMREWKPDNEILRKRERMLKKYPLPEGWMEVGDHDSSRYYYWNFHTDQVCWLSPTHPKADITQSAEQLGLIGKIGNLDSDGEQAMDDNDEDNGSERSGSDTSLSDEEDYVDKNSKIESRLFKTPTPTHSKQTETKKSRGRAEELDPMDPSSYSDVARGGWSDGLDLRGKAKTGVDETASGPLFQQRPYPSPGDILRANQSLKKKK